MVVQRSQYLYKPNTKQYVPLIFLILVEYLGYMGIVGTIKEIGRNNLEGFIFLLIISSIPITLTVLSLNLCIFS